MRGLRDGKRIRVFRRRSPSDILNKGGGVLTVIQPFSLVAVVLGIFFAEQQVYPPMAAISLPTGAEMNQDIAYDRDVTLINQLASSLARSIPTTWQWRERVRAIVQKRAATKGYRVYKALYDKPDYPDPDARAIFLFKSPESVTSEPHGLLVLTPEDYSALSVLEQTVEAEVDQRLFSRWEMEHGRDANSLEAFGNHVLDIASVLYAQPRIDQEFRVAMKPPHGGAPLIVECGDLQLSLDSTRINQLLEQPAVERDLRIAEMIEKLAPEISTYLRGPTN
jgi:hypothetical protein